MKPVSVAAFNSREEAEPLRARLVTAGIAAEIHNESPVVAGLDFARPTAGVRIEVPRETFETALQLVYGWNAGEDGSLNPPPPEWMAPTPAGAATSLRPRTGPGAAS